jgi:hypothetical protein
MARTRLSFDGITETISVHDRGAPVSDLVRRLKDVNGVSGVTSKNNAFGVTVIVQFSPVHDLTTVEARVRRAAVEWADQNNTAVYN